MQWGGARITPTVGLEMEESSGTTYSDLQQHTYEDLQQFKYRYLSERYEYVPLGIFYVDEYEKQRNTLTIKAMDGMMLLDVPYSKSSIDYPATLKDIYLDICNVCGVPAKTQYFTNMSYVVKERPEGDYTCRDILGFVAALAGGFAKFTRTGELEIRWYKDTDLTIGPENRFDFKPAEDPIQITGISYTARAQGDEKDTKYLTGTDEYEVDLGDNPLLQGSYDVALPNILNAVGGTSFYPFESSWQGNPALEAGDTITQVDVDGKAYKTLAVTSTYKYRGASDLSASGTSQQAKGYTSPENKKIVSVVKQQTQPAYDQLIELESVMDNANAELADLQERLTYAREQTDLNNQDLKQAEAAVKKLNEDIVRTEDIAQTAQKTADGKNTVFYAPEAPVANKKDDVWYDIDNDYKMYRWDGSAWAASQFGTNAIASLSITNALIANSTIQNGKIANLDAGKITTGTLMADRLGALSITADKIAAGAVTASKVGAGQITSNEIASKTITADNIKANAITANSGVIANAAITDAMIGNISANKISAGTITGITVRTAAGSNRVEMSDSSLKAYSAGVKRVEMDYDSIDFYTPRNEKGGAITAGYDAEHNVPTLFLDSNAGILKLESKEDDRHHASITLDSGYRYNTEDIESAFMSAQRGDGYSYIDVMPGDIELLATRSLGSEDISKTGTIHFSPERGLELQNPPEIHFGEAAFNAPYIDCRAGVFRMNSAVIPGTSVTYSGISLMADNKINIYFSGQLKHQFRADGTKTGGSIEIDGKTLGMSPIDSPRVLFLDVIPDIEAKPEGTEARFDAQFAKAMNGYKVFPNRPVDIRDKTPEGFTVVGEGKVDLLIIGRRVKYEDTYWQEMPTEEEENEQTDTGNEAKYYKRTESGTTADSSFRPHFRRYPKRYTAPADSGGTAGGRSGEGTGRKS